MSGRLEWDISNYSLVVRSLLDISVEAEKEMHKSLLLVGRDVASTAKSQASSLPHNLGIGSHGKRRVRYQGGPLRAARQRPDAGTVGYTFRADSMLKLVVKSSASGPEARAATIAEFASKSSSGQGDALVRALNSRFGSPGRVLWDSWDTRYPQTLKDVQDGIDKAAETINKVTA